jgi:hypothetical protein
MNKNDQTLRNIESVLNDALIGLMVGDNRILRRSKEFYVEDLSRADTDLIAETIFTDLDIIDIDDLWDNGDEFVSESKNCDEEIDDMIQEEVYKIVMNILEPFHGEMKRFRSIKSKAKEKIFCTGIIMGLDRYEASGCNDFREFSQNTLEFISQEIYVEWKAHNPGDSINLYEEHRYNH